MAAAAQAQAEAAAQAAASSVASARSAGGSSAPAAAMGSAKPEGSAELQRPVALYAGQYVNFTCSRDTNPGKGITTPWLTLRAGNGKEWAIRYTVPQLIKVNPSEGGLANRDTDSLQGTTMNVRFNAAG